MGFGMSYRKGCNYCHELVEKRRMKWENGVNDSGIWEWREADLGICNILPFVYGIHGCKYTAEYHCAKAYFRYP